MTMTAVTCHHALQCTAFSFCSVTSHLEGSALLNPYASFKMTLTDVQCPYALDQLSGPCHQFCAMTSHLEGSALLNHRACVQMTLTDVQCHHALHQFPAFQVSSMTSHLEGSALLNPSEVRAELDNNCSRSSDTAGQCIAALQMYEGKQQLGKQS